MKKIFSFFAAMLVAVAVTAVIVGPLCFALAILIRKRGYEAKVGSAEQRSAEIVEEATRTHRGLCRERASIGGHRLQRVVAGTAQAE